MSAEELPAGAPWTPLADNELSELVRVRVMAIAADLRKRPLGSDLRGPAVDALDRCLFFAYLEKAFPRRGFGEASGRYFATVVPSEMPRWRLFGGVPRWAWTLEHVFDREPRTKRALHALDRELAKDVVLSEEPRNDVIGGLAGLGVYAMERAPAKSASLLLSAVLERLRASALTRDDGITWPCPNPDWRKRSPSELVDLGVAHGVPGILGFLVGACAGGAFAQPASELLASELLDQSVAWLLRQRLTDGGPCGFPQMVPCVSEQATRTRVAWCYGDLGVAAVLLRAARVRRRHDWEAAAVDMARQASRRVGTDSGVVDASLCHGAAGNLHMFSRMWQSTGDPCLREAALFWLGRTLALHREGFGIGGYAAWRAARPGEAPGWQPDPSFLMGAAGVGLALLAAMIGSTMPQWDRLLLLSGRETTDLRTPSSRN
jgi:hypothetical protein